MARIASAVTHFFSDVSVDLSGTDKSLANVFGG
jgi:hypothetical protein